MSRHVGGAIIAFGYASVLFALYAIVAFVVIGAVIALF